MPICGRLVVDGQIFHREAVGGAGVGLHRVVHAAFAQRGRKAAGLGRVEGWIDSCDGNVVGAVRRQGGGLARSIRNVDAPTWDTRKVGWRVKVNGDAPFDADLTFPIPSDRIGEFVPAYNANLPVNAIPYVIKAKPGIVTTEQLPPILPAGPIEDR